MAVFHQLEQFPSFRNPVVTIGSFDGVHHGHKVILSEVVKAAKAVNGESILITFEPHPRKIIHPEQPLGLLTAPEQKIALIRQEGIDHVVVVPFTRDFSMMSASEYVADFLLKNFQPHSIIIGYDHRFGHSREGNIDLLKQMLPGTVRVIEIPAQLIEDAAVSSTKIRNALLKGNVTEAGEMLERQHSFGAMVVHGDKIGRTIGYPTANLQPVYPDILVPGIGIYAVTVTWKGNRYKGMMSIGYRPTVTEEKKITCEVNILDFNEDLYGQVLTIYFEHYIRGEEKFASLDELKQQIAKDELRTRELLS
ncbi:bifunctional riboflavin kinase/FAD synthetase [Taibaiella koreensis]|uniref:bifunctional riboflavin kinase/FAD synthetase n=1 Tax=Taibaiella koreensis TaxID=1268548 RepID=UPI000E5A059C|nr:bifunctional riboflavin kinase/FAD synthetase [Taibaiella koreensis]